MGRFGILSLSLFGSVARDEAEVTSDVDVLPDHSQGNADAAGVSPSPGSLKRDNCDKARPDPWPRRSLEDFREEYLEYDIRRQLELQSYGYRFLRINKFSLAPGKEGQTKIDVLSDLLVNAFGQ